MNSEIYWVAKDKKFYSKIAALEVANYNIKDVSFYFMDSVFDNIDWSKDIEISWGDLLKIRCQQLRNKFDHLCLWYSGGWDSHTVLQSFIKSNIPLDEIIIFNRTYMKDEEINDAINYAKYVKKNIWNNLKLTIIEITYKDTLLPYTSNKEEWLFGPGCSLRFSKNQRSYIHSTNTGLLKSIQASRGKRCDIEGKDKPRVHLHNNNWYSYMTDTTCQLTIGSSIENFYFSSDLPELHVKQTQMVINWMETLPDISEKLVHQVQQVTNNEKTLYHLWNMAIGRTCMNNTSAYYGKMKLQIVEKINNIECSKLENFAQSEIKNVWKTYTNGIDYLKKMMNSSYEEIIPTLVSKSYFVKKFTSVYPTHCLGSLP